MNLSELDKGRFDGWKYARANEQGETYSLSGDDVSQLWAFGFQQGRDAWINRNNSSVDRTLVARIRAMEMTK